jgi:uncharacterized BrkB/YihY/UPF0761 family membrane protein
VVAQTLSVAQRKQNISTVRVGFVVLVMSALNVMAAQNGTYVVKIWGVSLSFTFFNSLLH